MKRTPIAASSTKTRKARHAAQATRQDLQQIEKRLALLLLLLQHNIGLLLHPRRAR